jgi:hypothetical protein
MRVILILASLAAAGGLCWVLQNRPDTASLAMVPTRKAAATLIPAAAPLRPLATPPIPVAPVADVAPAADVVPVPPPLPGTSAVNNRVDDQDQAMADFRQYAYSRPADQDEDRLREGSEESGFLDDGPPRLVNGVPAVAFKKGVEMVDSSELRPACPALARLPAALTVTVSTSGNITDARYLNSKEPLPAGLRLCRFQPHLQDGVAVPAAAIFPRHDAEIRQEPVAP